MSHTLPHEHFMKLALQEAHEAGHQDEVPIGAVVVLNDKVIGRGHNMTEQLKDCTAHAEMIALTAAFGYVGGKYLPDATLYVTIEPCLMCAGALYWSKIGTVVYGARDIKNGFARHFHQEPHHLHKHTPLHPKTQLIGGILENECLQLMKDFFIGKR